MVEQITRISLEQRKERIGMLFLDSGAHSLYNANRAKTEGGATTFGSHDFSFYKTPEFWQYVDDYAAFIKANANAIDLYVNVDVIFNPKMSWDVLKYLEKEHGLTPVPVIHFGTDLKWIERHLEAGYDLIGLGGLGQHVTKEIYYNWADRVYRRLCPASNDHKPIVRTHGFAMTAYELLLRYPWWSVDSASWVKSGGFGTLYIPRLVNGRYDYGHWRGPYAISVSAKSPAMKTKGRSYHNLPPGMQRVISQWLDFIGIPLGSVDKDGEMKDWGAMSHHSARKIANLKFYQGLCDWLPKWPWQFTMDRKHRGKGFFA